MVKERVKVVIDVNSRAHATTVKKAIDDYVATLESTEIYSIDNPAAVFVYGGVYQVLFTIRLNSVESYEVVKNTFFDFGLTHETLKLIIKLGSSITHHRCPHDEDNGGACVIANQWIKATSAWVKTI